MGAQKESMRFLKAYSKECLSSQVSIFVKASQNLSALNVQPRWHQAYFDHSKVFTSFQECENQTLITTHKAVKIR